MSYIVFARKWRPQTFKDIIGQEHITTTLENAIKQGRVAHAYLFSGPRGVGKTTTARILAKALNCEKGPTPAPCNKCNSCKEINEGSSLDIIEIDGASNRGIDEIRNLKESVKFAPQNGRFKVYIIDEVHMLTQEAFNALLKTLEEPPAHVKFIFATTAPYKVISTILSRCQRFNFHRISAHDMAAKLAKIAAEENVKVDEDALYAIVRSASGSMRDAESLLDQLATYCKNNISSKDVSSLLGTVEQDSLSGFAGHVIEKDAASAIRLVNKLVDEGVDPNQFIVNLIEYFRAAMLIKEAKDLASLIELPKDEIEKIAKQTQALTAEDLLYILYSIVNAGYSMRKSSSPRLGLELLAIKLSQKESIVSLAEIMKRLSSLEKDPGRKTDTFTKPQQPQKALESQSQARQEQPAAELVQQQDAADLSQSGQIQTDSDPALYRIREALPQAIKAIKQEKIYIASCLNEGKLLSFKKDIVTFGFAANNAFHKESLEKAQNKKLIEEHFSKALGSPVRVEFITVKDSPAGPAQGAADNIDKEKNPLKKALADPIIKTALDIFDGNIMKFS